jgi:hypothetical protein
MHSIRTLVGAAVLFVLTLPSAGHAQCTSRPSMTGEWKGSDGASYFVRQIGTTVWWAGLGDTFTNVFKGTRDRKTQTVTGEWADVAGFSGRGTLVLSVEADPGSNRAFAFNKVNETGGFGNNRWSFACDDNPITPSR